MENTSSSRLKGTVQGDKKYPCGGCKKWPMLTPIYQCEEGHLICKACDEDSVGLYCKVCDRPVEARFRSRVAESLQPELTKCNQDGCDGIFANEMDMMDHVKYECNFIEISLCKILELEGGDCETKCKPGKVVDAVKHLKEVHRAIGSYGESAFDHRWLAPISLDGLIDTPSMWYIAQNDAVIAIKMTEKDQQRWVQVVGLGTRLDMKKLKMTLSVCEVVSDPVDVDGCCETTYSKLLTCVTDQNVDACKKFYTFDAGETSTKLTKLEFKFDWLDPQDSGFNFKWWALKIGQEVPLKRKRGGSGKVF